MKTSAMIKVNNIFLISIKDLFSMYLYCVGLCTLHFNEEDIVTKNYQYLWYTICVLIFNHKAEKGFAGKVVIGFF